MPVVHVGTCSSKQAVADSVVRLRRGMGQTQRLCDGDDGVGRRYSLQLQP